MKNILLILLLSLSTSIFCQTDYSVGISDIYTKSITRSQLENATKVTVKCKECKVVSYMMILQLNNSSLSEIKVTGDKFNSQIVQLIQKKKPKKIFIEKIIATIEDGTKRSLSNIAITVN